MDASFCLSCPTKSICTQICPELEKALPKTLTGKNTHREVNTQDLENLQRGLVRKHQGRNQPCHYDDNWENKEQGT